MKKLLIFITLLIFAGCFSNSHNQNESADNIEDLIVNISDVDVSKEILLAPKNLLKESISKDNLEIELLVQQEGFSQENFLFHYEICKNGSSESLKELSLYKNGDNHLFISESTILVEKLENHSDYLINIWAYNLVTEEISEKLSYYFNVMFLEPEEEFAANVCIEDIEFSRLNYKVGDEMSVTLKVKNYGVNKEEFEIKSNFISWNNSWVKIEGEDSYEINSGETLVISETYKLKNLASYLNSVIELFPRFSIRDINTEGESLPIEKEIFIYNIDKLVFSIEEVSVAKTSLIPGESNIAIRINIENPNNANLFIEEIVAKFKNLENEDVSNEWILTEKNVHKTIYPFGAATTILRYTLSPTATSGQVIIDARVRAKLGENEYFEIETSHSKVTDTVEVLDIGVGKLEAWYEKKDDLKTGDTFTVYANAVYSGNIDFSDSGELDIDLSGVSGINLIEGEMTQTLDFETQYKWIFSVNSFIQGKIRIYVNESPMLPTGLNLPFITEEIEIVFNSN